MAARKPNQPAKLSAFISHAKADAKKAQEIAASLEERGLKCWIAPRDVTAGRTYGDEIIRGIESAKAFVLVLSKGSNGSAFVAREVERAVSKQKPIFVIRLANIEPAPALELFISGTQWIDAFPGKLGPHIGKLAKLLGENGGHRAGQAGAQRCRDRTRQTPEMGAARWARRQPCSLPSARDIVFWPDRGRVSDARSHLMTKPVWDEKQETQAPQQMAAVQVPEPALVLQSRQQVEFGDETVEGALERPTGRALGLDPQGAPDADFQACEKASGDQGIAACDRAIASGKFTGRNLSYLHNDRGFLHMQKGELDQALVDLDEAIRIDREQFLRLLEPRRRLWSQERFRPCAGGLHPGARPESRRNDESEDCRGLERGHGKRQGGQCPALRSLGDQRSVGVRRRATRQRLRRLKLPGRRHAPPPTPLWHRRRCPRRRRCRRRLSRSPSGAETPYRFLKSGFRFSMKAAMPSF